MRRTCAVLVCICWLTAMTCCASWAADRKLIIAVLDRVTWHDLLADDVEAPVMRGLAEDGAVGLMSVRTARGAGGGYLTIGAGSRASGPASTKRTNVEGYALQNTEKENGVPASQAFKSYTGWPAGDNVILHLGMGALLRHNSRAVYPLRLGLLGGTLRRAGLRVACIGNADTAEAIHREIVCVAMDEQGLVQLGSVGSGLLEGNPSLPYRRTTNVESFVSTFRRVASPADVIVLELGETSRVEEYAQLMSTSAARAARKRAIERADRLLGRVLERLPRDEWAVMVLTPNARKLDADESLAALTPVIFYAPGEEAGILTSPSTRRAGLVVNTDVAATVLEYFGVEIPRDLVGQPMARKAVEGEGLERVAEDIARHDVSETARRWFFRAVPAISSIVLWATAFLLVLGERAPRWTRKVARGLLGVALSLPAAMLLVSLRPMAAYEVVLAVASTSVLIAFVGGWLTGWRSGHVLPAVAVVGLLAYDLLKSQTMLLWSPFSYSAAAGARFYGLGNEYAGVLLGAVLMAAAGLLSRRELGSWVERMLMALVLVGIVALVGSPTWGANLGMALGCALGFGVFALYLWRSRPSVGDVAVVLALSLALGAATIAVGVLVQGAEASHIGRWMVRLQARDWTAMLEIAGRKLSMNWLLVRVSLWTGAALAGLAVLTAAVLARPPALLSELKERPWLVPAVTACLVGAAASFLLNDSGIISAALILLYGAGSIGYVALSAAPKTT